MPIFESRGNMIPLLLLWGKYCLLLDVRKIYGVYGRKEKMKNVKILFDKLLIITHFFKKIPWFPEIF